MSNEYQTEDNFPSSLPFPRSGVPVDYQLLRFLCLFFFLSGNRKIIQNETIAMRNYENKWKGKANVPNKIKVK
jgi:hypothetical protein